jgi:hypothetical protein
MRTTWLWIVGCAILLCWAARTPRASAPGKPPPPCQVCYEAPPDAGDQDAASEVDGGADAAAVDSGVVATTPDAGDGTTADAGDGTTADDAATALDSGDVATPTTGSSSGGGCEVPGKRPDPAEGLAALTLVALIAVRLHRSKRREG